MIRGGIVKLVAPHSILKKLEYMTFWQRHPALFYGLFVYLGTCFALHPTPHLLIPILFLLYRIQWQKALIALLICLGAYLFSQARVQYPAGDKELISGTALVEITDVQQKVRYGAPCVKMQLKIHRLGDDVRNVTCSMIWKQLETRPQSGFLYEVPGTLKRIQEEQFVFTPPKGALWLKKESLFSLVEVRLKAKMAFKKFLRGHLKPNDARSFLEGLTTGEFNDPILAQNLRRFGLQHIMVVSGFHFSLLAACMAFVLRLTFSWKASVIALLVVISGYLLFLGASPSVMRAFVSIACLLIGKLFERQANGLNSLGIALAALTLYEPAFCFHLGFQLSFLATGAILLFYPFCDALLLHCFPKRSSSQVLSMSRSDQVGYLLLVFFRKSWALGLAVHLLMFPICIYSFHTFPLMGIVYNSFFPFLVGLCLFLLFCSCLFSFLPFVGTLFFSLCHFLTEMTLTFVSYAPASFDKTISVDDFSLLALILYLSLISFLGMYLYEQKSRNSETELFLNYV